MGNCQALVGWPEGILNILEAVFVVLTLIILVIAKITYVVSYSSISFGPGGGPGGIQLTDTPGSFWFILTILLLLAVCALLISYIFFDPRQFKKILLIFYLVAIALSAASFIVGLAKYNNCSAYPTYSSFESKWNDACIALEAKDGEYHNGKDKEAIKRQYLDIYRATDGKTWNVGGFMIAAWLCNLVTLVLFCVSTFLLV